jgi:FkbM family methyltransferase
MSSRLVASRVNYAVETLAPLLAESRAEARAREIEVARRMTADDAPPVVLFGAGGLGRRLRAALAAAGAPPAAFADNDSRLWGTRVDGTPVLAPGEAAARHGAQGSFVVAAWNPGHAFADSARQLHESGCRDVVSWIRLAWGLEAADLLPCYAAGRPSAVLAAADEVTRTASIWADFASSDEFVRQTRWRLSGDFTDLDDPVPEQYFPSDLLTLHPGEVFVDCGAFDGDTVQEVVARCPEFASIDAFEPDGGNFAALERTTATLARRYGARLRLHQAAADHGPGSRRFAGLGPAGAFVDAQATSATAGDGPHDGCVACVSLDDALKDAAVSFIKMDVEGAEADALRGAQKLLRERRPVLAVSAYHHQADLWRLPALVAELTEDYRLHLRAHRPDGFDCVLYAIPAERAAP